MDQPHQSMDETGDEGVKGSIKKLKERVVPGVRYTLLISLAVNFAMLVVGCLNVHKCPINEDIPLFLIATGAIGLMSKFVSYIRNHIMAHCKVSYIESALYSVECVFFFLGTYWVYKDFKPSFDPADKKLYCNKTAYMFAFSYLTIIYVIAIAVLLGFLCFLLCAWLMARNSATRYDVESPPINSQETTASLTNQEA